ncbi:hypothetical protein ACFFX0_26190 [Citricoccus parietis]|uniref:Secreted protein n=1 Tax=Citricoccus parietis TaxID=592307 RepID=A0ABV5G6C4_9MICC
MTWAKAWTWAGSRVLPEIGKFSTARWVWARYRASTGTLTSPMVSCSMRNCCSEDCCEEVRSVMVPHFRPSRARSTAHHAG